MFKNNKKKIESMFPIGTTVELLYMNDPQSPPKGTRGEVFAIDDLGQIHVKWENGSGLALIYGEDKFNVVK